MSKRGREEKAIQQRKLARKRFRTLIRSVYLNRLWLSAEDDPKMSLNVKRNIALLVRTQRKIGILTMAEKTLVRTDRKCRTIEDRKKLVTLIAGLKCFSKFPPKVRARLVPVIHYMYVTPGRTLMREGDSPHMVYFILTGEVEVTKKIYDNYNDVYSDKLHFISGPGDVIGEIEMLENCKRRNTYTSTTDVEMLVVFDTDFDRILWPTMIKMWLDQKSALKAVGYFDFMNDSQVIHACKLGILRQFEPLETIYYEDRGPLSYVHFVISGECMILQCLKMNTTNKNGCKSYKLVSISKDKADDMFQELTDYEILQAIKQGNVAQKETVYDFTTDIDSLEDEEREKTKRSLLRRMDIKGIEILCGLRKPSIENLETVKESFHSNTNKIDENEPTAPKENLHNFEQEYTIYDHTPYIEKEADESEKINTSNRKSAEGNLILNNEFQKENLDPYKNTEKDDSSIKTRGSKESISTGNSRSSKCSEAKSLISNITKEETNKKLENHFIDVGSLNTGAIFGLGEQMEHRVIMARTPVQCFMLPRYWLFEKEQNPGNIWKRRQFYLETNIPTREKLFEDFLETNRWQKFKSDFIQSINQTQSNGNPTKTQDIPIIGRLVESSGE